MTTRSELIGGVVSRERQVWDYLLLYEYTTTPLSCTRRRTSAAAAATGNRGEESCLGGSSWTSKRANAFALIVFSCSAETAAAVSKGGDKKESSKKIGLCWDHRRVCITRRRRSMIRSGKIFFPAISCALWNACTHRFNSYTKKRYFFGSGVSGTTTICCFYPRPAVA